MLPARRGLVAHYYADPVQWAGLWPDGASEPAAPAADWTFSRYAYSRVEPLVNHLFVRRGWFSARWTGRLDTRPFGRNLRLAFLVADGAVVPCRSYGLQVAILGCALSAGGRYDLPVTVRLRVGEELYEPWGEWDHPLAANLNDAAGLRFYNFPEALPAGAAVSVIARSWTRNEGADGRAEGDWRPLQEEDSAAGSPRVLVLRNGDAVPAIPGFLDQAALAEYVRDHVAEGRIVLRENEALFLFELGTSDLASPAADFQDLVALVSLVPQEAPGAPAAPPGRGRRGEEPPPGAPAEPGAAEYVFEIHADDGCRLTLDGRTLIDDWRACWEGAADSWRRSAPVVLADGQHALVLEYFQGQSLRQGDHDPVRLFWSCPARGIPRQIIPASRFWHRAEDLAPAPGREPAAEAAPFGPPPDEAAPTGR